MQLFRNVLYFLRRLVPFLILIGLVLIFAYEPLLDEVSSDDPSCPNSAIITVTSGGELGNAIWEYMSVYALTCLYPGDSVGFVPPDIIRKLDTLFESLSLSTTDKLNPNCKTNRHLYDLKTVETRDAIKVTKDSYITLQQYTCRQADIVECGIDRMKKEMQFKSEYVIGAKKTLASAAKKFHIDVADATFVGVHYRGSDYNAYLLQYYSNSFEFPTHSYYQKAMDFFTNNFKNVIFIVISIDLSWVSSTLPLLSKNRNVIVNPNGNDRNKDLVLLSHCNHSIINYGSYGVTGAVFANGITFVYDTNKANDRPGLPMRLAQILPHWHLLGNM